MRQQVFHRREDDGDAGFVIRAEQGRAVGGDQRVPVQAVQRRKFFGREHLAAAFKRDVTTAIVLDDLWFDVLAAAFRRGIDVRHEAQHRHFLVSSGGQGGKKIALVVKRDFRHAQRRHFITQEAQQIPLLRRGRHGRAGRIGGGVHLHITLQPF